MQLPPLLELDFASLAVGVADALELLIELLVEFAEADPD